MAEPPVADLEKYFKQVPLLEEFCPDDFQIKPLPGLTNQNLHLKSGEHDWVLRIPKQKTNQYINRKHEAHNAQLANKLAIAPECIWRDESGLSLSRTLSNSHSPDVADLNNKKILSNLVRTIARLHKSINKFRGVVDLTELLPRYYQLLSEHLQSRIKESYKIALSKLEKLSHKEKLIVPSHNDLVLENILIGTEDRIWLIDWEYASMAPPYWDLATLCNAADFNQTQCTWLLCEYEKHHLNLDAEILFDYRYMLGVLSICWTAAFSEIDINYEIEKLIY